MTTLQASWSGFSDNLSGIAAYEYAIGTDSLQSDLKSWTAVNLDTLVSDNSFSLNSGQIYHVSVRAIDSVGNLSAAISTNGIIADHVGPSGATAVDGDSGDIDRQNFTNLYSGHWTLFNDELSGLSTHEYALYDSTASAYLTAWDSTGLDTAIVIPGLNLTLDHMYQLHVRGVDQVNNTGDFVSSNGVLVDLSAPAAPQSLLGFFSTERIYLTWDGNVEEDLSFYKVYAGSESDATVPILETENPEAEAFMPAFQDGQLMYLNVTAVDVPGNESPVSNQVYGIPQPAVITRILPDTLATLLYTDNQISIHFSQPLSDIGTIDVSSLAYTGMNIASSYSEIDTAIKITVNDPWASLDTVSLTLSNILDWAENGTADKTVTFATYLLGDYNQDFAVNVTDLASFVSAWTVQDYGYELGPATGSVPHLIPARNELYDLRDVMVFTRMWHYSHQTSSGVFLAYGQAGPDLDISQEGQHLIINLPQETGTVQAVLSYPVDSKTVSKSDDVATVNMIQLSYHPEDAGQLLVEKAFMTDDMEKQVIFEIASLDREDAVVTLDYIAYDRDNNILASGAASIAVTAVPVEYTLHQNYPNPFNPVTTILYDLPENGFTEVVIYDIMGREVTTLIRNEKTAGYHSIVWDGRNSHGRIVGAGMYFYQVRSGSFIKTRKMLLLK
ncbi:MAG TPA: T9SS type A sorting domain-containing protein [Candidatus Marinimicrobia bacterium]|nr:T9SS type A sorting domain-containing protein [Candidatus Neomarinimicrobiota bacterium]